MTMSIQVPKIKLNDGIDIPQIGLGVWRANDDEANAAVLTAIEAGYRHVDTAMMYKNERGVGNGVRDSGIDREEVFLTSKIWNDDIRNGTTAEALDGTLERLGTPYVDLMLLHWPAEGRVDAWRALIAARDAGKVRSIGVSNFLPGHIEEIIAETGVLPVLNQIEHHPLLTQPVIKAACERHGIAIEAWSPLMQGKFGEEAVIGEVAASVGKSEAQVVLRWALQKDVIVIPKSTNPSRIAENLAILDFTLGDEDMSRLDALDRDGRLGPDPATFDF